MGYCARPDNGVPSVTVEAAGTYRGIGIHDPPCREPLIATGRNSNPLQEWGGSLGHTATHFLLGPKP